MIVQLMTQLMLATAFFELYPHDAGVVEARAVEQASEPAVSTPPLAHVYARLADPVPALATAPVVPVKVQPMSMGAVTSAVSAIVVDRRTGTILYEKNAHEPRSIGSITKLMTAYVFLETRPDLDASAMVEAGDVVYGGVQHVAVADQVTVRDLLHASLIGSDNSSTAALVRLSGMPEGDFVARMNEVASDIGMRETTFMDPTGLSPENRSTAPDVATMLDVILKQETIREATEQTHAQFTSASGRAYAIESTDELLETFLNRDPYRIIGGKTGFLPEAGYCLGTIVSESGGHEIIVVVLGSETLQGRFKDVKSLAAWTYRVFDWPDQQQT